MFWKETHMVPLFLFSGENHPRKDETNETENKPVVRRIGVDRGSAGDYSICPWRFADMAFRRRICRLERMGIR